MQSFKELLTLIVIDFIRSVMALCLSSLSEITEVAEERKAAARRTAVQANSEHCVRTTVLEVMKIPGKMLFWPLQRHAAYVEHCQLCETLQCAHEGDTKLLLSLGNCSL